MKSPSNGPNRPPNGPRNRCDDDRQTTNPFPPPGTKRWSHWAVATGFVSCEHCSIVRHLRVFDHSHLERQADEGWDAYLQLGDVLINATYIIDTWHVMFRFITCLPRDLPCIYASSCTSKFSSLQLDGALTNAMVSHRLPSVGPMSWRMVIT